MTDSGSFPETVFRIADCASFLKTKEKNGGCSNMASGYPIMVGGIRFLTSEALYQACRFPAHPHIQAEIIAAKSPMGAKFVSKREKEFTRPDWFQIRVPIMRWAIRAKLMCNFITFGSVLIATKPLPILELGRDTFWGAVREGDDTARGQNVLGRLLDELLAELLDPSSSLHSLVPPVDDMLLLGEPVPTLRIEETARAV